MVPRGTLLQNWGASDDEAASEETASEEDDKRACRGVVRLGTLRSDEEEVSSELDKSSDEDSTSGSASTLILKTMGIG